MPKIMQARNNIDKLKMKTEIEKYTLLWMRVCYSIVIAFS